MVLKPSTLRPGLLVSLKTTLKGNVRYVKTDIDHIVDGSEDVTKWETERHIADKLEHERAVKARSKARACITGVCAQTDHGLLCPQSREDQLEIALADARRVADEFNSTANVTRLSVYAIIGRVADSDVEAVRAINAEIRELLADMSAGLEKLDVEAVRAAANKAKNVSSVLSSDAQGRVQGAIDAARIAARDIQAKIKKAGEQAVIEIDRVAIEKITQASVGFVDLDDTDEIATPATEGRGVDLDAVNYIRDEVEPELKACGPIDL
jgi:hypothetical protein